MNQLLKIIVFIFALSFAVHSQQKTICNETTNFLIDKEKPNVYLSFEQFGKANDWEKAKLGEWNDKSKIKKGSDIWLRLHNNSCWDIRFRTDSLYLSKVKVDGKDKIVFGILEDGALSNIQYAVEEQDSRTVPYGGHSGNISSLPSGKSTLFGVLKEHLSKSRSIFVGFNYGWEVKDFSNNLGPEHHAFFWGYRLEEEREK